MVVIIQMDKTASDDRADAQSILLVHLAEPGGLCRGCHEHRCSFAWFPCPQVRWARQVLATTEGSDAR